MLNRIRDNKKARSSNAFTLIELLVVIAIIALLLSIVMPSLRRARELAQNTICRSNLRQWHVIWQLYLHDNNNRFAPGWDEGGGGWFMWMDLLEPYFQDEKIYSCPIAVIDETSKEITGEQWGSPSAPFTKWRTYNSVTRKSFSGSYGYNQWVSSQKNDVGWRLARMHWTTDMIRGDRGNIPLFADCRWNGAYPSHGDPIRPREDQHTMGEMDRFMLNRHQGGINIVFLDGSGDRIDLKDMLGLRWNREFDTGIQRTWPDWIESVSRK